MLSTLFLNNLAAQPPHPQSCLTLTRCGQMGNFFPILPDSTVYLRTPMQGAIPKLLQLLRIGLAPEQGFVFEPTK